MKAGIATAVALAGALGCGNATADGNQLLTNCRSAVDQIDKRGGDRFEAGVCLGYVSGTFQTLINNDEKGRNLCTPPEGITGWQLVRVVELYLRNNPELLHLTDSVLIERALRKAYPCTK